MSYRYNPCPCTGQGVSCRDGEKRPHITFWTNPSTWHWHSFSCDTCPHRDPHSMFYNLFFFCCCYKLNPSSFHWLFRGALCPLVSVHSISLAHFGKDKLSATRWAYANRKFYIYFKNVGNFSTFLGQAGDIKVDGNVYICSTMGFDQES